MASVYEVIKTINQIALNAHDGAVDDEGEPLKIGLKREEGHPIRDKRIIDGFGVKFSGNLMRVTYESECTLKDVYEKKFEASISDTIDDILAFLKREYRKVMKETLSLKQIGEVEVLVQHINRSRTWVQAVSVYEIKNIKAPSDNSLEKDHKIITKWLKEGKKRYLYDETLTDQEINEGIKQKLAALGVGAGIALSPMASQASQPEKPTSQFVSMPKAGQMPPGAVSVWQKVFSDYLQKEWNKSPELAQKMAQNKQLWASPQAKAFIAGFHGSEMPEPTGKAGPEVMKMFYKYGSMASKKS